MHNSISQFLSGGDSLIAPLDIARFALAYLALVFLPGFGFATLVRPELSRVARMALAIPCAYAIITIFGLATVWLRLPFDATTYLAVAVPIILASGYQAASAHRSRRQKEAKPAAAIWPLAPLITAMLQLAFLGAVFVHRAVPSGDDVVTHIMYIAQIAHTHSFPLVLLNSGNSKGTQGEFYPPTFHAVTALVLNAMPMPPYRGGFYSILACVAVLPLGLYAYVRQITDSMRAAGIAALGALAFGALPSTVVSDGLYPFVASQLFIPAFAITFIDAVTRKNRRSCLLAALIGIGLFYTHPTELLTAALLAGTGLMVCARIRIRVTWLCATTYAAACGLVWALAALPVVSAVRNTIVVGAATEIQVRHAFSPPSHISVSGTLGQYLYGMFIRNASYVLMGLVLIGCIYCLSQRRYRALAIMQLVMCAIYIDSITFDVLQRFYDLSFPWALPQRLAPTNYWFALPLAGIGADALLQRLGRGINPAMLRLAMMPVAAVSLALPLGVATLRDAHELVSNVLTHPSDLHALAWLERHAPANSVVVNEAIFHNTSVDPPMDAAVWLPALTSTQPLVARDGMGPGSSDDRQYLLEHVTDVPLPARAARFVQRYHVRYVFYGAQVFKGFTRYMKLPALLADPNMTLAYSSAASCRPHSDVRRSACPTAASYVFALHLRDSHTNSTNQVARISHGARQG